MQSTKRPIEIDPDYELSDSTIKRLKIKEHQGRLQPSKFAAIKGIINRREKRHGTKSDQHYKQPFQHRIKQ